MKVDYTGKLLSTVYNGINNQNQIVTIQVNEVSSGLYFFVLKQNGMIETKKISIVKEK